MENFNFSATGYAGFEDELLRVRNSNRSVAQTRRYLDWRYAKLDGAPEPVVFWIKSESGETVGMASLIFRKYWVNARPVHVGVLGDISLHADLRGKGHGRQMLEYVKNYLAQHMPDNPAFVIPNEAARKSLISAGWKHGGKLVSYVLPLAHIDKLARILKSNFFIRQANAAVRKVLSFVTRLYIKKELSLQLVSEPDTSFETLWSDLSKENLILSDRGFESLFWRYSAHPHNKFSIAKLMKKGAIAGYLIYTISPSDKTYQVYDLLVKEQEDIFSMLALFLIQTLQHSDLYTIRLVLNDTHPYCKGLWKLGFIKRDDQPMFYKYWPVGFALKGDASWLLSLGDKDI